MLWLLKLDKILFLGLFLFAYNISSFFLALNHEEIVGSFDWIDVLIRTSF